MLKIQWKRNRTLSAATARLPDGQITGSSVQPRFAKYFGFAPTQITSLVPPSCSTKGAARDRHGRGTGCNGRGWRERRTRASRTAKSCGSDAPMLASSWRSDPAMTVARKPVTGKSTKQPVKTIARGMSDDSGVTVVTMLVCFLNFAREAADASAVRHSLRPLFWAEPARQASRISRRDRITACAV
jgi:hypothetical protein